MNSSSFFLKSLLLLLLFQFACEPEEIDMEDENDKYRIMTLNPGHFHAALVQKTHMEGVDNQVHVFAPEGDDLELHMERIESFNTREDDPTNWDTEVYTGDDYLSRMLEEQPGNIMVTAGNNRKKADYIYQAVDEGINVLSDKPMAIDHEGWDKLEDAFKIAEQKNVLLYDIMTERHEVSSRLLRELIKDEGLFGELITGSDDEPAIYLESIHHLYKQVAGSTLRRPPWYFDIEQQGEGIVDVTVHLVDLTMWTAFPDQIISYEEDVQMLQAERWPTMVTREEFEQITGKPEFPDYLTDQLDEDGVLPYYSNGEIDYLLNGHHMRVMVQWDYEAPPGSDDRHFKKIRGTRSNLVVRQDEDQDFEATLYVEPADGVTMEEVKSELDNTIERLQVDYPGADYKETEYGLQLVIPDEFHYGHEAHFGMVAENFLQYLQEGALPDWEVPNMISKYYITTRAREMAKQD
ncbi:putative oxidoreductase C-terminal domain-containing protein [Natronogracilivirga saccharolytica]|uniref:Putative oxidoreductase C-terminal domain-containing protein n=1 Tax=Natronogracilivirga saccharolytica TaxID=2812953 RepID=A0A8J7RW00_9BACT|nr:putative oxidoreductase C-terminal domain-containing protein [Natronogracilivirga saccharolytica]MBP3193962.1 hypothetical protein [Natronogracilivirga saccharolytica]